MARPDRFEPPTTSATRSLLPAIAPALLKPHTLALSTLAYTYAVSGNRADALKILEGLKARSRKTYVSPAHIATVYAGLGEKDQAFEWLERAYTARSRSLAWLNVAREWDGLRSDPRFTALLAKVGLAS